ncbi:hypothetical protein O181_104767 [Austropuccinia psidii MF-1]|uniref:Uncharacterized protein n=1 Tax=Austropuccinia psidii MF-1 TaxID=1389203 RepID=A0A9Q3JNR4_9BASI|nr:hypothetical protein [Austropuccinia psidii MF-1]
MPIKHSPPAGQTRSLTRAQAVLIPTPRAPPDDIPAVPQLRVQFGRSRTMQEGRKGTKKIILFSGGEEDKSVGTEGVPAPVGASQGTGGPTLAQCNQSEPSILAIMQKMTHIMANLQKASSSEASRPLAFKTKSMKAPKCFYGTQPFKVRSFIQYCKLMFHNDPANFCKDRKKFVYSASFLIGSAEKQIEPCLFNLTNQDPSYLLNS